MFLPRIVLLFSFWILSKNKPDVWLLLVDFQSFNKITFCQFEWTQVPFCGFVHLYKKCFKLKKKKFLCINQSITKTVVVLLTCLILQQDSVQCPMQPEMPHLLQSAVSRGLLLHLEVCPVARALNGPWRKEEPSPPCRTWPQTEGDRVRKDSPD